MRAAAGAQHAGAACPGQLAARCEAWRRRLRRACRAAAGTCAGPHGGWASGAAGPEGPRRRRRPAAAAEGAAPAAALPALPAVGEELRVSCERLGVGGVGVCPWGPSRLVLLVRGALPGEEVVARVTAVKRGYAEAAKVATLRPHDHACEAACAHFGACGGCTLQTLGYPHQLRHKAAHVAELLSRVGGVAPGEVAAAARPPVAAPEDLAYGYRNKAQLAFGAHVWRQRERREEAGWGLGYLLPGSSSVVLPVDYCSLLGPEANHLISAVRQHAQELGLQPHDAVDQNGRPGVLRHLIVRSASGGGAGGGAPAAPQLMAVLVTTPACRPERLRPLAERLVAACPCLVSVVHSTEAGGGGGGGGRAPARAARRPQRRPRGARALAVGSTAVLAGRARLVERLCGLDFDVSPHSFFQTNTAQAERLYGLVVAAAAEGLERARAAAAAGGGADTPGGGGDGGGRSGGGGGGGGADTPGGLVLDLYCGTGTIALALAARCGRVVGVDVSASSIADARANAARNGVANASFVLGDLDRLLGDAPAPAASSSGAEAEAGAAAPPAAVAELLGPVGRPEVVVVDPARAGLGRPVVRYLAACGASRVVYVSCNAATQARDLALLSGSFRLASWTAVDLFPQTDHVESVAVLDRLPAAALGDGVV